MRGSTRHKRRWLRWVLLGAGLCLGTFLIVSWMLFQHVPSWYRPLEVPPDQVQHVQADLMRTTDALNERMVLANRPFEFRMTQDQLNAWLAAREDMWPLSREWLPPGVSDPFVTIDEDGVRLAATVQFGSIQAVLSLRVAITVDEERIGLRLVDVSSGSLPIPRWWVEEQLVRLQETHAHRLTWATPESGEPTERNHLSLAELYEGVHVPNEGGTWRQPGTRPRRYRVIGLRLEEGALTAMIRPVD